ncbi:MAG: SDR family NAD(P)-dependent oxidoreductase [Synergistes jonesii]|uniref:SDR family NAD(P)-dependent oxidoreductase n=1 Tax=Synergistes jonesii TaxID=2754 RepID=UPI002A755F4D|nr:SDR family NAD(P)-dependent oxidoreductase [Synergistes jonesii]MDY2983728.1 SDR family NAD(P)-dependent oxidoreductase [Synergistes jonesii]
MKLAGKVSLVSGAGAGMGQAAACLFAKNGAKVVVSARTLSKGEETVRRIKEFGGDAVLVHADVSKLADIQNMVKATVDAYGKLDILFANAGIPGPGGLDGVTEEAWQTAVDVNLKSCFFSAQYAVQEMRKAGGGSIVFDSSIAGIVGSPMSPVYSATKGGIVTLTKSLALLLARDNIRVNCVCPGPIDTKFVRQAWDRAPDPGAARLGNVNGVPLGRMGSAEEVAKAVLFLASDDASYITGTALPVDGGYLAR